MVKLTKKQIADVTGFQAIITTTAGDRSVGAKAQLPESEVAKLPAVRMDLRDDEGLLSNGRVWLQADDIDLKPWLGKWMQDNIALETAQFSLEGWMTIDKGDVTGGDVWLKQGGASWLGEKQTHTLSVDNLTAGISSARVLILPLGCVERQTSPSAGESFAASGRMPSRPASSRLLARIRSSSLRLLSLPPTSCSGIQASVNAPLGQGLPSIVIRVSGIENCQPGFSRVICAVRLSTDSVCVCFSPNQQPSGKINTLALDIPLQAADKTRFQASWSDLAWKQWKLLPGAEHFSGTLSGSVENGLLTASMKQAKMPYETVFRAPLEIADGQATISWLNNDKGFQLDGRNIDVKAKAVHARGGFRYLQPANDEPWLGILAGISTDDGSQAWRYFPENLMGKDLVDYLSGAIQGGEADNATLVYGGNPQLFPYKHNEGQFEVLVPLRNAKFAFQPDWPALTNLDIELDFINDGLWMKTDGVNLGGVRASNLTAVIPDYSKEKLLIDADIKGPGKAVGPYFDETPLKDSLGATLQELQLDGDVNARLHLDIPLNGELVTAKGEVTVHLYVIGRASMIRQINAHFTIPRHAATQCFVHRFRQNAGFRRLPVTVEIHRNLVGFCPFFGGKIHVQRLIKPACCQWFTLQIAIDKAEFTAHILNSICRR